MKTLKIRKSDRAVESKNKTRTLMVFELSVGGHYGEYIAHIVKYWQKYNTEKKLYIVVVPSFSRQHPDVVDLAAKCDPKRIQLVTINSQELARLKPHDTTVSRNIRAWQEYSLAGKYARKLGAEHIFFPYFDSRQIPLLIRKSLPCSYSGIYFRPSFHYQHFGKHQFTWKDWLQKWREKLTLSVLLKDSQLKNLFCLDPFAVKQINLLSGKQKANHISDPVKVRDSYYVERQQIRAELGIEESRQIYLLFGGIDSRKGFKQLLESIDFIPQQLQNRLCILVVGAIDKAYYQSCTEAIDRLRQQTEVQIIIRDRYIPETEIQKYFELADVILALYQRHVGMSGIINRAAATQKPVLSSDYGLMGELTRRYQLGLTIDSTIPEAIAQGLVQFLTNSPKQYCNFQKMQEFAQQNTPQRFAQTIFQHIFTE